MTLRRTRVKPQSWQRTAVFRLAAVLLGLAPFVALEAVLRWFQPPAVVVGEARDLDPLVDLHQLRPLFEPVTSGDFIGIPESRRNFFQPAQFSAVKPSQGRRIFVVGGSTVQGRPYSTETAFAQLLQVQLQTAWPGNVWEVVNCGGVSYAAYRVSAIVEEVLQYEPDAVVVYTGHNEFLEDRTYAAQRRIPRSLAPLLATGCRLRIVQWPASLLKQPPPQRTVLPTEVDTVLDHPGGLQAFERDGDHRRDVIEHFHLSLRRIAEACQSADVPLILCVPASDTLTVAPFKSTPKSVAEAETSEVERVQQLWQRACDPVLSAQERVTACREVLDIDPQHAGAAYMWGRQLWQRQQYDEGAEWLRVARDRDVCPLRATGEIESLVRQVAKEYQTPLVDVPQLFADPKQPSICLPRCFVDHVHPRIQGGHTLIADALYQQIAASPWLNLQPSSSTADQRSSAVRDYLLTIDESYYQRGNQRLEGLRRWAAGRAGEPLEGP